MSHACHRFLEIQQNPHVLLTFDQVHNPLRLPWKTTSELPKVVRTCRVFNVLTSKCASCHNGAHFFDISTSKSALNPVSFFTLLTSKCASHHNDVHFFDITTSKSAPKLRCFVHFDLECASRHNGVQLFISHFSSSSLLFSSLTLPISAFICTYCRKFDFQTSFDKLYLYSNY